MRRLVFIIVAALLSASAANAQQLVADSNHDGKVTQKEYQDSRRTFLMRADKDKDGKLSKAEWDKGADLVRAQVRDEGVNGWPTIGKAGLFGILDTNTDGFVTPAEIDAYYGPRFTTFDTNHDGFVTGSEANAAERAARKK